MKFRKKAVVIAAIQFVIVQTVECKFGIRHEFNDIEIASFMQSPINVRTVPGDKPEGDVYIEINTLEGVMKASLNDWIIKGVNGEFYPCKPDIFYATYEAL